MTLNAHIHRRTLFSTLLLAVFICLLLQPSPAVALGNQGVALPGFGEFVKTVRNSEADVLRGVYVPDVLAFPVSQQPSGNNAYVSDADGEITQFDMASRFGNVGLLAHNHLSGRFFSQLSIGQEVRLVYGDGKVEYFVITQILQFQAFQPTNPYSSFRDLKNDEILSAGELFNKVYGGERHVRFQTCIAANENLSWGRLFVLATPKPEHGSLSEYLTKLSR